ASFEDIEYLLEEWIYVGFIDAGHVTHEYRCECGRPLRYQHIVEHKKTGQKRKFGIQHLEDHMQMDAKTVQEIVQGFEKIDFELDEIIVKLQNGWDLESEQLPKVPDHLALPHDIQEHFRLRLPLLD